jgi:hypothetical protein
VWILYANNYSSSPNRAASMMISVDGAGKVWYFNDLDLVAVEVGDVFAIIYQFTNGTGSVVNLNVTTGGTATVIHRATKLV